MTAVGCGAMAVHTQNAVNDACAQSVADAVVIAQVAFGDSRAQDLARRLGAAVTGVEIQPDGSTQVMVATQCGDAISAAVQG